MEGCASEQHCTWLHRELSKKTQSISHSILIWTYGEQTAIASKSTGHVSRSHNDPCYGLELSHYPLLRMLRRASLLCLEMSDRAQGDGTPSMQLFTSPSFLRYPGLHQIMKTRDALLYYICRRLSSIFFLHSSPRQQPYHRVHHHIPSLAKCKQSFQLIQHFVYILHQLCGPAQAFFVLWKILIPGPRHGQTLKEQACLCFSSSCWATKENLSAGEWSRPVHGVVRLYSLGAQAYHVLLSAASQC